MVMMLMLMKSESILFIQPHSPWFWPINVYIPTHRIFIRTQRSDDDEHIHSPFSSRLFNVMCNFASIVMIVRSNSKLPFQNWMRMGVLEILWKFKLRCGHCFKWFNWWFSVSRFFSCLLSQSLTIPMKSLWNNIQWRNYNEWFRTQFYFMWIWCAYCAYCAASIQL